VRLARFTREDRAYGASRLSENVRKRPKTTVLQSRENGAGGAHVKEMTGTIDTPSFTDVGNNGLYSGSEDML